MISDAALYIPIYIQYCLEASKEIGNKWALDNETISYYFNVSYYYYNKCDSFEFWFGSHKFG